MKTTFKFRTWLVNYKPPPIFESKVSLEHNKPCLFFCVVSLAGFRLQLRSWVAHIDLWPKSLEYYYLVLDRKSLPTSAHADTARLTQKWAEIWNISFFLFFPRVLHFPLELEYPWQGWHSLWFWWSCLERTWQEQGWGSGMVRRWSRESGYWPFWASGYCVLFLRSLPVGVWWMMLISLFQWHSVPVTWGEL